MILLSPIDNILQNPKLMAIPIQLFEIFKDPNWFNTIVKNCLEKSNEMAVMILTIPGATCYSIGYRIAAIERFLFGIIR